MPYIATYGERSPKSQIEFSVVQVLEWGEEIKACRHCNNNKQVPCQCGGSGVQKYARLIMREELKCP